MRRCEVTICQIDDMRNAFSREISTTACRENDTTPLSSPARRYSGPAVASLPVCPPPPAG